MVFIIIPVFNRWYFTQACIETLKRQTYSNYKVLVVDHGSTDGTRENVKTDYTWVELILGNPNMWWTAATNAGIHKALELSTPNSDFILTLNNDLIVKENYIQELLEIYENNKPAIIGSLSVDIKVPEKVHFAGTLWNKITAKYKPSVNTNFSLKNIQEKYTQITTDLLPGRGVLIPMQCFKEVGMYDDINFPHYMADEEFALRCKKKGYNLFIAPKAVVYSHVEETGLKLINKKKSLAFWKAYFTSVKSPNNLKNRWNWAKKAGYFPFLYFCFDISRIVYSQFKSK